MTLPYDLTPLQQSVVDKAKEQLKSNPWFGGVCLDHLWPDHKIQEDFQGAVDELTIDTFYWDGYY